MNSKYRSIAPLSKLPPLLTFCIGVAHLLNFMDQYCYIINEIIIYARVHFLKHIVLNSIATSHVLRPEIFIVCVYLPRVNTNMFESSLCELSFYHELALKSFGLAQVMVPAVAIFLDTTLRFP